MTEHRSYDPKEVLEADRLKVFQKMEQAHREGERFWSQFANLLIYAGYPGEYVAEETRRYQKRELSWPEGSRDWRMTAEIVAGRAIASQLGTLEE